MADAGLFIGWGNVVRGREQQSITVFNEAVEFFMRLQQEGAIEGFETAFLEPHGGDLGGFILLRGRREAIAGIRTSEEFNRLNIRANQVVDSYGVVGALIGDSIPGQVELFLSETGDLTG